LLRDRELVCRRCGIRYMLTAAEQRKQDSTSLSGLCPGCRALDAISRRRRGTVKWFDRRKGYGFVRDPEEGDLFMHASALEGLAPRAGQRVEYAVGQTDKGPVARDVVIVRN
jgi:cold shock protein